MIISLQKGLNSDKNEEGLWSVCGYYLKTNKYYLAPTKMFLGKSHLILTTGVNFSWKKWRTYEDHSLGLHAGLIPTEPKRKEALRSGLHK